MNPAEIKPPVAAPVAERRPHSVTRHGDTVIDNYDWLRDADWRSVMRDPAKLTPEIRAHLEAENAYTASIMDATKDLRIELVAEMRGRIAEDDSSVPQPHGPYEYYTRFETSAEYPIYARKERNGRNEEVLVHGPREAVGRSYYRIAGLAHSPDHVHAAIATDPDGSEECELRIREISTGRDLPDLIKRVNGDVAWANDGVTLFYTLLDDEHRPNRVYRHRLGDDPANDVLVYEEADNGFFVGIDKSESERFIFINSHSHSNTSEIWLIEADAPTKSPVLFAARETGHEYDLGHVGDKFFIRTNEGGAKDFKIMQTPVADFARGNWREVVAHKPGRLIRYMSVFADYLVRMERENALPSIVVRYLADGREKTLAFDEEAYELGLSRGYEFATDILRISYASMTTPERIYDIDLKTDVRTLRKEQRIPSGHDPAKYVTRRLWAVSHDGVRVPITLLHQKGLVLDGAAPMLLYGYGAYGSSMPASFGANRLSLVDRGFVYAIAHIRGGSELGQHWYETGKLELKTNTFRDFIACAEHLIAQGYTSKGKIVAEGRSAGGMLVGAVANMRPDLFRGIIAGVPFVDVLNTICDASLPLTPPEWVEWGNPIEDAATYARMKAYCPYTNVSAQSYPHVFAIAGLTDPRVTYWEPAKWVAKLRAIKTDDRLLMLHTVMEAGHGGASGRFARLEEVALSHAFAIMAAGLPD